MRRGITPAKRADSVTITREEKRHFRGCVTALVGVVFFFKQKIQSIGLTPSCPHFRVRSKNCVFNRECVKTSLFFYLIVDSFVNLFYICKKMNHMSVKINESRAILEQFMTAWGKKDFKEAFKFCQKTWISEHNYKHLITLLQRIIVKKFEIVELEVLSPEDEDNFSMLKWTIEIVFGIKGKSPKTVSFFTTCNAISICELYAYKPDKNGIYGVNPISLLKGFKEFKRYKKDE